MTTYSALVHWGVTEGDKVGVIGIGGLGHIAVMIAKAMGARVTAITTSEEKRAAAFELGTHEVLISSDKEELKKNEVTFAFILCTIPESFDVNPYVRLLKYRATLVTVGLLGPYKEPTNNMGVAKLGRSVGGSLVGGIVETQEVLDFCAEHQNEPLLEMIRIQEINDAFEKIKSEDVRFRYVIDIPRMLFFLCNFEVVTRRTRRTRRGSEDLVNFLFLRGRRVLRVTGAFSKNRCRERLPADPPATYPPVYTRILDGNSLRPRSLLSSY